MSKVNLSDIVDFLKLTSFFSALETHQLEVLASQFESISINSGQILINEGAFGDYLYLIVSGHLRVIRKSAADTEEFIVLNEMGRGELLGELALLTDEMRTSTVVAVRDSILLRLSKEAFREFLEQFPMQALPIVKAAVKNLITPKNKKEFKTTIITLAPAGSNCPMFMKFSDVFIAELSKYNAVLHLNESILRARLKQAGITYDPKDSDDSKITQWLNDQEPNYKYIIYQTNFSCIRWTQLCLRQADKILLIACSEQAHELNTVERGLFAKSSLFKQSINLVLLHDAHITFPKGTREWLSIRPVNKYYHVKLNEPEMIQRLARCVTDKAIALVCGGGGARGLAYIGVYKALRELNIPIDHLGGTSSGALISAFLAYDYSPEEIINILKKVLIAKRTFDYTLPLTSLLAGYKWAKQLKLGYGDEIYIEDLWKPFFCVATNLSQRKLDVIDHGLVWKAVRASISLPVIVPPISNDEHELLIDGGVINNLPVDIMYNLVKGSTIIATKVSSNSIVKVLIPEGTLSGFHRLFHYLNPFTPKGSIIPNISEIILYSIELSSEFNEQESLKFADHCIELDLSSFSLMDFKPIDELIEIGYRMTMEKMATVDIKKY